MAHFVCILAQAPKSKATWYKRSPLQSSFPKSHYERHNPLHMQQPTRRCVETKQRMSTIKVDNYEIRANYDEFAFAKNASNAQRMMLIFMFTVLVLEMRHQKVRQILKQIRR